jgi:anti-anti-sigma regulatory factor
MAAEQGWTSGTGSALLPRELAPPDLTGLVPAPRREIVPVVPDPDDHLDVRLHAPTPETVIVWVAGSLHPQTVPLLTVRVLQQLRRARDVVIDLSSLTWMDPRMAAELRDLHEMAAGCGTRLHVAAENELVVDLLRRVDPEQHVVFGSADAVRASLPSG